MATITVVLADDHALVRRGVRTLLAEEPDLLVVGEASDGLETIEVVQRLQPEVAVVDLMMPGLNGIDVTHQIVRFSPHTRVVILSMYSDLAYVAEAVGGGAAGYVLKDSTEADLVRAVREVSEGRRYLSSPISEEALQGYLRRVGRGSLDPYKTLTTREREVLHLAAEGRSSTQIGARLGISPRTAETHRANLMDKLSLRTQSDLIRYALERGIVPRSAPPAASEGN